MLLVDVIIREMKFFTMAWWSDAQDWRSSNSADPLKEYPEYLKTLGDRLPKSFAQLNSEISLHDCRILSFALDVPGALLTLTLSGDDGAGGLRIYTLFYDKLCGLQSSVDPDLHLLGPHGYGDLGYNETDVNSCGELVHRLLFSTGIEFEIRFGEFKISWEDC